MAWLAACCLLASTTIVLSPPALGDGNSPSSECSSTDPAWNGDFWKIESDDGTLSDVETNIAGAITLATSGSWTNNNEDPVFRVVLKIDDDDDDEEVQVFSGIWETGEGGTIDIALDELDHVTFCATSDVVEESESTTTTTTLGSTTTTAAPVTTTTIAGTTTTTPGPATTTTAAGTTTTTGPVASPAATPDESTTTSPSEETTTNPAANPEESGASGIAGDGSQADETVRTETDDNDSSPDAARDTTAAGPADGGPGDPPALGQEASDAGPDLFRSPHLWTLADLAILGGLIAALGVLVYRRRLRRLVWHLSERWR